MIVETDKLSPDELADLQREVKQRGWDDPE